MSSKNPTIEKPSKRGVVVTIMGHVDHGKTTLLDKILSTNVASRESGGITQSVRAYQIFHQERSITFIDTPGHEAFFAMRERGSKVTDIIVLVIAADDGVMPQTKEVIELWKKSKTALIVAINKIDAPGANVEKVKRELATAGVLVEGYGGDVPLIETSAKEGTNIDKLLDLINLVAEISELDRYTELKNVNFTSESIVLESNLDKSLGPIATVIIKSGLVKRGEYAAGGAIYGKLRAIINDKNKTIDEAYETQPVRFVGIPKVLKVGEIIRTFIDERLARENSIVSFNETKAEEKEEFNKNVLANLFMAEQAEKDEKKLNLIMITDTNGSLEALTNSLERIDIPGAKLEIIDARTGNISLQDIDKAAIRKALILGFNARFDKTLDKSAEQQGVLLKNYNIIYELIEDVEAVLISMVDVTEVEEIVGEADVRQVFALSNGKFVAGCRVTKDKIIKGYKGYFLRKGERVHEGKITSLRHIKEEVKEAGIGTECGILIEPNAEVFIGDKFICYREKR